ncbi:uncharacterized protein LOC107640961 [Arachis ipaensis]|uniref:uncharacterized protein LOC107640961 n=1 Tax=Arachis ipaensis TaxID=130454 RepID=UPI0007AF1B8A|nr:uncharacterized protein LOC107640961 [Arachis ipaensis]
MADLSAQQENSRDEDEDRKNVNNSNYHDDHTLETNIVVEATPTRGAKRSSNPFSKDIRDGNGSSWGRGHAPRLHPSPPISVPALSPRWRTGDDRRPREDAKRQPDDPDDDDEKTRPNDADELVTRRRHNDGEDDRLLAVVCRCA